ncbi:MAG: prenyltransferase/squalene oxidase repeat-containing protein [bacterium]
MNIDQLFHGLKIRDTQGGLASWEEPQLPLAQRVKQHWREMLVHLWGPAGSMAFHVVAVGALLTMCTGTRQEYPETGPIEIATHHTEEPIEPKTDVPPEDPVKPPDPAELPVPTNEKPTPGVSTVDTPEPAGSYGTQQDGAGLGPGPSTLPNPDMQLSTIVKPRLILIGLNTGDSGGGRPGRLKKYIDDNPAARINENAVLAALRWLKREQQSDGSWAGSKQNVLPAMTSMALLAYLARGEKPESPEFGPTVKRGIEWLLANQEPDGRFKGRDANDYTQPIAAYALCEAYALTGHLQVREAAIRAVARVVKGQNASGGFNYNLDQTQRNDSSYMAWCCQALKAARSAKLQDDVPGLEAAIKKGVAGFKLNADPGGGFGYAGSGRTGLSGAGTLCLQLLGASHAPEVRNTLKFLEGCTFSFATPDQQPYGGGSPLYYWYYVTQAKFNHSREMFAAWDRQFSPELRRTQQIEKNAIAGPDGTPVDVGHWESPAKGEHSGGTVQDTALCTLMLEVYYRYLSTSQPVEADPEILAGNSARADDNVAVKVR